MLAYRLHCPPERFLLRLHAGVSRRAFSFRPARIRMPRFRSVLFFPLSMRSPPPPTTTYRGFAFGLHYVLPHIYTCNHCAIPRHTTAPSTFA